MYYFYYIKIINLIGIGGFSFQYDFLLEINFIKLLFMNEKLKEGNTSKNILKHQPKLHKSSKNLSKDERLRQDALSHELDQRNAILKNLFKVFKK